MGLINKKRDTISFVVEEEFEAMRRGRSLIKGLSDNQILDITKSERRDNMLSKFKKVINKF